VLPSKNTDKVFATVRPWVAAQCSGRRVGLLPTWMSDCLRTGVNNNNSYYYYIIIVHKTKTPMIDIPWSPTDNVNLLEEF